MNKELKEQARKELEEKKFETILGGYCWFQDGGNGGYEYEDILKIIDSIIDKTVQQTQEKIVGIIESLMDENTYTEQDGIRYDTMLANKTLQKAIFLITNKNDNE